jgi:hypothetical protein
MKKPAKKLPKDPNKLAYEVVRLSAEDFEGDLCDSQPKTTKPIKVDDKNGK